MSNKGFRKVSVETLGCRLNQYETERMAAHLYPLGFTRAQKGEKADLYLINTCTVTHRADRDGRALIRRAHRANPDASIVVAGCYVESDPSTIAKMDGVDVLIRNSEKAEIAQIVLNRLPHLCTTKSGASCQNEGMQFAHKNRAWLKISDGCNQWCSFCILPKVRGRLRNRPPLELIGEVHNLVRAGFNEVVLTGIHLGHYKNRKAEPQIKNLAALCQMILSETEIRRIRLSSIEPQTVRDNLLDLYANSGGRICRHFHMPLQSGSSRILRQMQRPYNQKTYLKRIEAVKTVDPKTIIGADVIVGFPGETEEDFAHTCRVCESGLLDYLHVFSYSDRAGTRASEIAEKVPSNVIRDRSIRLSKISRQILFMSHQRQVGDILEVIAEKRQLPGGGISAVSDNYVRVKLPNSCPGGREIFRVKITDAAPEYVSGELVQ